jgi:hypothetical protein
MAEAYKVLAQSSPIVTTDIELYASPAGTQTVISSLVVSNRSTTTALSYRIAIVPFEQTLGNKHYIAFDVPIAAKDVSNLVIGLTLGAGDKVIVRSSTLDSSFNIFGVQFS